MRAGWARRRAGACRRVHGGVHVGACKVAGGGVQAYRLEATQLDERGGSNERLGHQLRRLFGGRVRGRVREWAGEVEVEVEVEAEGGAEAEGKGEVGQGGGGGGEGGEAARLGLALGPDDVGLLLLLGLDHNELGALGLLLHDLLRLDGLGELGAELEVGDGDVLQRDVELGRARGQLLAHLLRHFVTLRDELLRVVLRDHGLQHLIADRRQHALVVVETCGAGAVVRRCTGRGATVWVRVRRRTVCAGARRRR